MFAVLFGGPSSGFDTYGPFGSYKSAQHFIESEQMHLDAHVVHLTDPVEAAIASEDRLYEEMYASEEEASWWAQAEEAEEAPVVSEADDNPYIWGWNDDGGYIGSTHSEEVAS